MYSKETTKNRIQDILNRHNLVINIESDSKYYMSYNKKNNTISFNQFLLYDLYNRFIDFEPEDIIEVAVCHELGHYLFYQRHNEITDKNTKELYAWQYGKEFVLDNLLSIYLTIENVFLRKNKKLKE